MNRFVQPNLDSVDRPVQPKGRRPYRLKKRAEGQAETRKRIVDATVKLHTTIGPSKTSISAIARQAGVERLTVYQHFPDPDDLFRACLVRSRELVPEPDPSAWSCVDDPEQRLRTALRQLYSYYGNPVAGREVVIPDLQAMPAWVRAYVRDRQRTMVEVLRQGWPPCDERLLEAALGHAMDFFTFRSLVRQQELSIEQAIEVIVGLVKSLSTG